MDRTASASASIDAAHQELGSAEQPSSSAAQPAMDFSPLEWSLFPSRVQIEVEEEKGDEPEEEEEVGKDRTASAVFPYTHSVV